MVALEMTAYQLFKLFEMKLFYLEFINGLSPSRLEQFKPSKRAAKQFVSGSLDLKPLTNLEESVSIFKPMSVFMRLLSSSKGPTEVSAMTSVTNSTLL